MNRPVVIVGGSLSGLSCALALSARGFATRVPELAPGSPVEGARLGVELSLPGRVTGRPERLGLVRSGQAGGHSFLRSQP